MHEERRARASAAVLATAVATAVAFVGCDGGGGSTDAFADRKREILGSLGGTVIRPALQDFAAAAEALEAAAAAHAADPSDANRVAAQDAWIEAMSVWQRAELMQLGPAGMGGVEAGVAGGMDLRDEIYSWPSTSSCRVDQETVDGPIDDPDALGGELVNVRGLDALEYLLFAESLDNTCSELSPINAEGTWAALSEEEIVQRRATYAHSAAVLVARTAAQLAQAWAPAGGDWVAELSTAGAASETYATAQQAMNDLAGAMLYLDTQVRDMKLGEPAGITGCTTATCLESLESPWANRSKAHILENLRGFQRLFLGGEPGTDALGIDDLLVDVGAEDLAVQLTEAIAAALVAVEAIDGTLREAIEAGDAAVMAAYDALGLTQRLFKVDVVTVLDLEPTGFGRLGDND
jgi:predicted lipoprotein